MLQSIPGYNPTLCVEGGGKEGYLSHIHLWLIFLPPPFLMLLAGYQGYIQ